MNELTVIESTARTAVQIKAQVQLIQQVMEAVMKQGVHYDTIPGTDKPTLLKPGAEKLMSTFLISADPQVEDLSTEDEIRYRVRLVGTHQSSGTVMGIGVGECSSHEEKYKWRRAVCDEEFDQIPEDRKRTKFARGQNKTFYTIKQVRTEAADVANTILKMAKKRALVDFTLTALAASDIFAQDLEDMPEEIREATGETKQRKVAQPKAKSAKANEDPAKKIEESQARLLRATLEKHEIDSALLCKEFGIEKLEDLPFAKINDALKFASQTPE